VERKSKTINDIDAVQRFRKLLTVGYTVPPSAGVLVFAINYIINAARISNPIIPILFSILFFPPVLFTPYILFVLFKEKRFGWIAAYIIMVIIPGVIAITVLGYAYGLILLILFAPFYLFCFFIKFSVDEWIREFNWEQQLAKQRKESEEKKKEWLM
jgi:hypothetical protein